MPSTLGSTLRGRTEELATVTAALDRAVAGTDAVVWVQGPAGIGKTRLLTEVSAIARERGFLVADARADELEQARPFGLIAAALGCTRTADDPSRAAIAALIATHDVSEQGVVTITSDPGLQFRVIDAFGDLVEQLAAVQPVLLALDDLQWSDGSSLLTIHTIQRRSVGLPVVVVGCLRPGSDRDPVARLLDFSHDGGQRDLLVLGPLPEGVVDDLAADVLGARPGPGLLDQLARAGGNPFFVTELLSALRQEDCVRVCDCTAQIGSVELPSNLRLTLLRRLSQLPAATLEVLRSAAIIGSTFTITDLSATTGRSVIALSTALGPAVTAGVVDDDGVQLRFHHDLIHDAIYCDIPASVRAALHREAGQRLIEAGAAAPLVAGQLLRAGDPRAGDWLLRAARQAAPHFPDVGVELYDEALRCIDATEGLHSEVEVERAEALLRAGRLDDAIGSCRAVLDSRGRPTAGFINAAQLLLGTALIVAGHPAEALEQLEPLKDVGGPAERATVAGECATASLWLGHLRKAEEAGTLARVLAAQAVNAQAWTTATATLSVVAGLRSDFTAAMRISDEALGGADASSDLAGHRYPLHATRGFLLIEMDELDRARAELDAGRQLCERLGVRWPLSTYQAYLGVERFRRGRWDDAMSELQTALELIEDTGVTFAWVLVHATLSLIALRHNDLTEAARSARAACDHVDRAPQFLGPYYAGRAMALVHEATGQIDKAAAVMTAAWHHSRRGGIALGYPLLGPDVIRLALARGDDDLAEEVVHALQVTTTRGRNPSRHAALRRCRGLQQDEPELLAQAGNDYSAMHRSLEAALTRHEAGSAFLRHGRPQQARDLFDDAARGYRQLGAHRDLLRLEADLRAAGMPRGRRGARRRPTSGWAALTDTEREVAGLVADGLTNPRIGTRMFISPRTVQTHVSHVFTKLDLSSRAQLAAEVTRRRAAAP